MFSQLFNWRTLLAFIAITIVSGTIIYSNHLGQKIAADEKIKIEQWVEAVKDINNPFSTETILSGRVIAENSRDIPMIAVTEKDSILDYYNIDTARIKKNPEYLYEKLAEFKAFHQPIEWKNPFDTLQKNRVYYGESKLLKQVKYYPMIQLVIVALFIIVTLVTISTRNKSTQNQVWAGMAKETAHQLGTPLSSLQGWLELLKENKDNDMISHEMEKDIDRLKLVSDRFGKIGSIPNLEPTDIAAQIEKMVSYIKKRATDRVSFKLLGNPTTIAAINAPLFDWVIENLLKNALDAMEGKGSITIQVTEEEKQILIDVTDSGKGISKQNIAKVFKPGFTTKKRGWGLGLSLSKRIIEHYHKGHLFVKHSEPGKGTTFRIVLKK